VKIVITENQYNKIIKEDVTPKVLVTLKNPLKNGYDYQLQLFGDNTRGWQMRKVGSKSLLWYGDKAGSDIITDYTKIDKLNKIWNNQTASEKTKAQTEYDKKLATWKKSGNFKNYLKGSLYSDKLGMPVHYYNSVEFKNNSKFLKNQGLVGYDIYAESPVQHFNICALESIRKVNDALLERFKNNECFRVGLSSFKGINGVSRSKNLFSSYDYDSLIAMFKTGYFNNIQTAYQTSGEDNLWKNLSFGDFQFGYGELMAYVKGAKTSNPTTISKGGFYNFYFQFFAEKAGTSNVYSIMSKIKSLGQHSTCGPAPEKNSFIDFSKVTIHDVLSVVQIFSYLIPIAGPIIAAGIGTIDAGIYFYEGKTTEAAITLGLSILPFVSRIPAIKNVGVNTWNNISKKIASGAKLDKVEAKAMALVDKYKDSVNNDLKAFAQRAKKFADGEGMSDFKKETLQKKVKNNVKEAMAGDYGVFLSRWKGGPLQKTLKASEQGIKYYRNYLKKTNLASNSQNLKPGDLRKGKNNYFAKFGEQYYTSKIGAAKNWYSVNKNKKLLQDVQSNWEKYTVLT
jgi:hypothetical protein